MSFDKNSFENLKTRVKDSTSALARMVSGIIETYSGNTIRGTLYTTFNLEDLFMLAY